MTMMSVACCLWFIGYIASSPTTKPLDDVRIVGGEDIEITDAPYQVSILKCGRHICGGSIILKDIIITAAHCVMNTSPLLYKVRAGSSYSNRGGQLYRVADLAWHPDFNFYKFDSDVAILKLSRPLILNSKVALIEMANENQEIEDGELTVATGWGATQENGGTPKILQSVKVPKMNDIECSDRYKPQYNITPRMLCAGTPAGAKDACQGDSGGPLICQNKLSGIVSWGIGCARPNYPGVYAKVSALREWIDINTAKIRLKRINDLSNPFCNYIHIPTYTHLHAKCLVG